MQKYAIRESENAVGDTIYRVYMQDESGAIVMAMAVRMIRESNSWNPSKNFRKIRYGRTQNFRKENIVYLSIIKSIVSSLFNGKVAELDGQPLPKRTFESGAYRFTPSYLEGYRIHSF